MAQNGTKSTQFYAHLYCTLIHIFYTNLCGQSIKSTKSITLKGEETCEAPLIAVGPKCVSCEFIEKDSYYEIGEDGKGQCVKECKSYKYDGDHRCYNNCKDIFIKIIYRITNNKYN